MPNLSISTQGMIDIISHEGICLSWYLDSVGVPTIGIGQTKSDDIDPRTMGTLTLQQAVDLFKRKIKVYTDAVDKLGLHLTQYQYDALSSCCYNFGESNLQTLCHHRTIDQIGDAIMLYKIPPEIIPRREAEQKLFKTGVYSNTNGKVLVFPVNSSRHPVYSEGHDVDIRPYFADAPPTSAPVPPAPAPAPAPESSWLSDLTAAISSVFGKKK
ncbi:lysozyme [Bradyrhizobium cenepequi]|uniref:lysozyme n=1 Tax=Bradyrhizobium cenepequi TaxID=2821403 RepID=UPI001CE36139|nr:lysozyme [Bradyrhizobium cenepequi]MCA6108088.1 lysozyme [Bradyrhizobium cenepequi]